MELIQVKPDRTGRLVADRWDVAEGGSPLGDLSSRRWLPPGV